MSGRIRHCDTIVVNVKDSLQCFFIMLDGKVKCEKTCSHEILLCFSNHCLYNMLIATMQNVEW